MRIFPEDLLFLLWWFLPMMLIGAAMSSGE
jgi:hypothetical protein